MEEMVVGSFTPSVLLDLAEQAGCVRLAPVSERLSPYLTTALDKESGLVHRSWTRRR